MVDLVIALVFLLVPALFFLAGDVDGVAAKAKELGGAEHLAPMSVGGARLAVLADPQGAAFSILQPPPRG